ncbi:hypothetical protein B5F86_01270 [Lachnoclostridium sp. An298]|nr:hypothetical protein B5F86_01270 [Lachnoclostridium sp. An298]
MEENEKYEMIKCPHCQKDVTHIDGTDYKCPYCGKSLNDEPEKESRLQKVKQYILRNKVLVAITACLVIILLAMSGTVSSAVDQRQELTEEYEDLENSYDSLSSQYHTIQSLYNDIKDELTNYQDQQATIDDLNTQLTDLQEKYDTLSAENEELKSQVSSLQTKASSTSSSSSSSTSSSSLSNDSGGGMVWLSATGSKYHSIPDCGNMNPNNARQVSRSSAESQGYDACSKCW